MPAIRVRFIATEGFVGAAIRQITGSLFEHVELGTSEGTWIGAHLKGGIQERPAGYCKPFREYVYDIPCTDDDLESLMAWARSRIGTPYNLLDIIGLMFQARSLRSPHRYICSQFALEGLLHVFPAAKVLNVLPSWAYRVTPETLHLSPIFVGRLVKRVG